MYHREAQLCILLYEEFGNADVDASFHLGRGGAARDDVQFRPFLHYDEVMDVLLEVFLFDIKTGLYRIDALAAGQRADHVPVVEFKGGRGRIFVLVHRNELPEIIFYPVVLFERFLYGHHFDAVLHAVAVDDRGILLEVSAPSAFAGDIEPGHQQPLLFLFGQPAHLVFGQILVGHKGPVVSREIQIVSE